MNILYEDLFEDKFVFDSLGRTHYYEKLYVDRIKQNKKVTSWIIKDFHNTFVYRRKKNEKRTVVVSDFKFSYMMENLKDEYNVVVICNGYNEYKKHKEFNTYFPHRWVNKINMSFMSKRMDEAANAIQSMKRFFQENHVCAVLTGDDKLFIDRAMMIAAKDLEIPTINVQHGMYNVDTFSKLKTSHFGDYFWSWSGYVKDLYMGAYNKAENSVKIIGYPFKLPKLPVTDKKAVLFLGNQYKNTDVEEGEGYLAIAKTVYEICKEEGYDFIYRPHPAELIDDSYGELLSTNIIKGIPLDEDLKRTRVVVGDISSVLIEAGMRNRQVVQVIWSERSKIGYTDPLYKFTIKCNAEYENVKSAINKAMIQNQNSIIDDYYVHINEDIKGTTLGLLNDLVCQR